MNAVEQLAKTYAEVIDKHAGKFSDNAVKATEFQLAMALALPAIEEHLEEGQLYKEFCAAEKKDAAHDGQYGHRNRHPATENAAQKLNEARQIKKGADTALEVILKLVSKPVKMSVEQAKKEIIEREEKRITAEEREAFESSLEGRSFRAVQAMAQLATKTVSSNR